MKRYVKTDENRKNQWEQKLSIKKVKKKAMTWNKHHNTYNNELQIPV